MIGDKRLEMPKTMLETYKIINDFGFKMAAGNEQLGGYIVHNARCLVELNNEVYDMLHNKQDLEQCLFKLENPEFVKMCKEASEKVFGKEGVKGDKG